MKPTCRKKPYHDKRWALANLHFIQNIKDDKPKPIRVYECPLCGKWHITSKAIDDDTHQEYKLKLDWSKFINN